jgi:hypothetical protein
MNKSIETQIMKTFKTLLVLIGLICTTGILNAQVGIGNTDPQGALEITSTTDGLVIPRVALTNTTTVTVTTPIASELVYNTTNNAFVTPGFYYLLTAAGPWVRFGGTGWLTNGNTDIISASSFMGTINDVDVPFRRFNLGAGRLASNSTSFGLGALNSTTAGDNVAIGNNALRNNTGIQNVALGFNSLTGNTGSANIGIGWNAAAGAGNGNNNIAIGFESFLNNTNSSNNIAIGFQAMRANQISPNNIAIGFQAMSQLNNNNSNRNVAVGYQAMQNANGNLSGNSFLGTQAGINNTGNFCTGVGMLALGSRNGGPSSGVFNTAVGHQSLSFNTSGQQNTAIGVDALFVSTTGSFNTGLGYRAGSSISTGSENTFLGYNAGNNVFTSTNNIAIGFGAQVAVAGNSHQIKMGDSRITLAQTQVGWTLSSDRRFKSNIQNSQLGLDFIKTLRPVSYTRNNDDYKKTEYGFIAQELEEALIDAGDTNNGIILKDDEGMYGVRYNDFIPMTVKAIQEQQVLIEKLQKDNEELKATNAAILKRLDALEKRQ